MNVGMIGSGLITQVALDIFERLNDVKCTAMFYRSVDKESASLTKDKYAIDTIYDDIDAFLADDSFQTVYIGVINSAHYEYAKKALLANKHVICEKAFTSNYKEAEDLANIAKEQNCLLFGANRLRYLKNFEGIKNKLSLLGDIKMIMCNYSQYSRRYDEYLKHNVLPAFDPALSGGCLYDINVYNVHFVVSLFGEPQGVQYYPNKGFNGIDTSGILIMDYGPFKAVCCAAKDSESAPFIKIQGTNGHIDVDSIPVQVRNVNVTIGNQVQAIQLDQCEDVMENEFLHIFKIIKEKDEALAREYLSEILIVMKVLEQGRVSAGIKFAADNESIN